MKGMITCMTQRDLSIVPFANATTLNPARYSQLHTLAPVEADHEAVNFNRLIPNGTADHTKIPVVKHQIDANWCIDSIELQSNQL